MLPPVSLYKVGGFYFVLDGHHCVSVACYHGVKWIEAYVTEFGAAGLQSNQKGQGGPQRSLLKRRSEDARDDGFAAFNAASRKRCCMKWS